MEVTATVTVIKHRTQNPRLYETVMSCCSFVLSFVCHLWN